MTKIQLTTYKSIIGSLALETVKNSNNSDDIKSKDWFKKLYKVYKKFNQAKKVFVNPVESKAIKDNIEKILVGLRDKYFYVAEYDGYEVNNYSLVCEILAHLVYEKNLIEYKNLLMDLNHTETQIKCETDDVFKGLQKKIYLFISEMIEINEGKNDKKR